MKDLIVMSAGDLSKDVTWLIERINSVNPTYNLLGFTEISEEKQFMGYPILGNDDVINNYQDVYVVCAIANTQLKEKVISSLGDNVKIATLIDPQAIVHPSAIIEEGSMVFANALIGINAKVGKHCVVLHNASVNHDVVVGDYTTIYPGATISGKTTIGKHCEIGTNASIIQHVSICDNAKIGVGAAVFTNVVSAGTTYGNPAMTMQGKKKES